MKLDVYPPILERHSWVRVVIWNLPARLPAVARETAGSSHRRSENGFGRLKTEDRDPERAPKPARLVRRQIRSEGYGVEKA